MIATMPATRSSKRGSNGGSSLLHDDDNEINTHGSDDSRIEYLDSRPLKKLKTSRSTATTTITTAERIIVRSTNRTTSMSQSPRTPEFPKRPFQNFPLEVVYAIIDQTDDRQLLTKWTLVSKGCNAVANRKIWANTTLKMLPGVKTEKANRVLDLLLKNNGERAGMLQSLCIQAHIWRQTLNDHAHEFMKKLNLLLARVHSLERLFLHILFFHPHLDIEMPNLRRLPHKVRSLTVIANPHLLQRLGLDSAPRSNLHLACFQTDTSQKLPMCLTPAGAPMARLTSLDIQNVSRAGLQEDQIEAVLKEHRHTLRHLGISSGTASRDEVFLMKFPVLESFIFSTFHCHHHNPERTTEVLDFLLQFFSSQQLLRSVHLQFGDVVSHDRPLSAVMPRLPHLANLSLRSWLLKVTDLVDLAARQPGLESLAVAVDLPPRDPNDNRVHNPRRAARSDGYVHKHPTLMNVLTRGFPRLRVLSMDAYDSEAPRANCYPFPMQLNESHVPRGMSAQPRVDFFRDFQTFENFARDAPESLRLFSTWFTNATDGSSEFRTFGIKRKYKLVDIKGPHGIGVNGRKKELKNAGVNVQNLSSGEVKSQVWPPGVQRLGSLWKSLSSEDEASDVMFRDLGGMPVWFL